MKFNVTWANFHPFVNSVCEHSFNFSLDKCFLADWCHTQLLAILFSNQLMQVNTQLNLSSNYLYDYSGTTWISCLHGLGFITYCKFLNPYFLLVALITWTGLVVLWLLSNKTVSATSSRFNHIVFTFSKYFVASSSLRKPHDLRPQSLFSLIVLIAFDYLCSC